MHEINIHKFAKQDVDVRIFMNLVYNLKDGKNGKHIDLIIKSIKVHIFMEEFNTKYLPKICETPPKCELA